MAKYWLGNNPNGEVTDAQIQSLKALSTSDMAELENFVADLDPDNIPMAAETDVPAATAANDDSDLTEILVDVGECRTAINSLLSKLRLTGLLTS